MRFDHVAHQVPDIAGAIAWWKENVGEVEVLYEDESWGLLDANGTRLAFVLESEHPSHWAWRVSGPELERLAEGHGADIADHRDGSRSIYVEAPGGQVVEIIAFPDARLEDEE